MGQYLGEFIGTFILVLLGNGVVAGVSLNGTKSQNGGWLLINFGWAAGVALGVYASGFYSPAHLNPAVTIAFAAIGQFDWSQVPGFILAQFLGAMLAQVCVVLHYYPHYQATKDSPTILGTFSTAPGIRHTPSNFFGEALGTAVLIMSIMAMGPNQLTTGLGALVVGIIIAGIGFSLGPTTGYAINPARDLGPRLVHAMFPVPNKGDHDWGYAWIPVVAPIVGGLVGAFIFNAVLNYI